MPLQTEAVPAVALPHLVRQVRAAVKKTNGHMLFDLIIYDEDEEKITAMLLTALEWGDERGAVKYALESLFGSHEETMKDAAQDGARSSMRAAINSLPNSKLSEPTHE